MCSLTRHFVLVSPSLHSFMNSFCGSHWSPISTFTTKISNQSNQHVHEKTLQSVQSACSGANSPISPISTFMSKLYMYIYSHSQNFCTYTQSIVYDLRNTCNFSNPYTSFVLLLTVITESLASSWHSSMWWHCGQVNIWLNNSEKLTPHLILQYSLFVGIDLVSFALWLTACGNINILLY